jgi:hypothetical protein
LSSRACQHTLEQGLDAALDRRRPAGTTEPDHAAVTSMSAQT